MGSLLAHIPAGLLANVPDALPVGETEAESAFLFVLIVALVTVAACVTLHYEVIGLILKWVLKHKPGLRRALLVAISSLLIAHLLQISLFGLAYAGLERWRQESIGRLVGEYDGSLHDRFYFSAAVFTTVGFGDITPEGEIRTLVAIEALTGLVLVTWSASFTFIVMQRSLQAMHDEHARHEGEPPPGPAPP